MKKKKKEKHQEVRLTTVPVVNYMCICVTVFIFPSVSEVSHRTVSDQWLTSPHFLWRHPVRAAAATKQTLIYFSFCTVKGSEAVFFFTAAVLLQKKKVVKQTVTVVPLKRLTPKDMKMALTWRRPGVALLPRRLLKAPWNVWFNRSRWPPPSTCHLKQWRTRLRFEFCPKLTKSWHFLN